MRNRKKFQKNLFEIGFVKNWSSTNLAPSNIYLGAENEATILKVSSLSPDNSKKRKEEFFYTKANPSLTT
ncbi:hypothetical protein LEP1GSC034_3923 [Leptospira interrogans str. 2003000735]|uniref:Uncharacterized protein n=1 Tax=Leptospira interrogans str. 2002000626 TaxID=996803 RepID=A0A829D478_LEPIR|nr:hypothetical protein LEP1GSC025_4305 [Leptospira interrogans str. 2002000621]EMJ72214.1 hypothetical protein LEP1GSC034_3923 [Leptospira interrogans str. 2003000735]EMY05077.1 hypothetical protein LEP1GSC029_0709 [Leptospira interrogans str. 2002000626]MCR8640593.1 hypothetical protein [Leptospira interrogans serovar Ricardi]MCR8647038.1 hypothetical protein [Leptospira interrogans serovar Bataviae]